MNDLRGDRAPVHVPRDSDILAVPIRPRSHHLSHVWRIESSARFAAERKGEGTCEGILCTYFGIRMLYFANLLPRYCLGTVRRIAEVSLPPWRPCPRRRSPRKKSYSGGLPPVLCSFPSAMMVPRPWRPKILQSHSLVPSSSLGGHAASLKDPSEPEPSPPVITWLTVRAPWVSDLGICRPRACTKERLQLDGPARC